MMLNKMHVWLVSAVVVTLLLAVTPQSVAGQETGASEHPEPDAVLDAGNVLRKSFNAYQSSWDCKEQRDNLTLLAAYHVLRRRHGVLGSLEKPQDELITYLFAECPTQSVWQYPTDTERAIGESQSAVSKPMVFSTGGGGKSARPPESMVFSAGGGGESELRLPFLEAYLIMTPEQRDIIWNRLTSEEQYFYHFIIAENYEEVLNVVDEYGAEIGQDLTLDESIALPPNAAEYGIDLETVISHYGPPIFVDPSGVFESIYDTIGADGIVVGNQVVTSFEMNPSIMQGFRPESIGLPDDGTVIYSLLRTVTVGLGE